MLVVTVELLHGTFRGDPDGAAMTGRLQRGEWPPAPSRLFAAFVAADGTGPRCRVTSGAELDWFESLSPPRIHAHSEPWHQKLQPRYVVRQSGKAVKNTHQEYIGRMGVPIRPGVRVSPRQAHVIYVWNAAIPDQSTLDALRLRAARIGYLGGSDSPVRVRVETQADRSLTPNDAFVSHPLGDLNLGVPRTGDIRILDRMYDEWTKYGPAISRSQFPALSHKVRYRSPRRNDVTRIGQVVAWLGFGKAVSGRRISTVTKLFKAAVLSKFQTMHGTPPSILHGHGFEAKGYETARYLALPDVGFRNSRGRIHGVALWMPPGTEPSMRTRAGEAALAVRWLRSPTLQVALTPRGDQKWPLASNPRRWERSSRTWVTAFPAIHERHRPIDLKEVSRWCTHAGLPAPVDIRWNRTPLVPGAVDLAPIEVNRRGRKGRPYSHVALRFAVAVRGPVAIGSGRQRGFGLCVPLGVKSPLSGGDR